MTKMLGLQAEVSLFGTKAKIAYRNGRVTISGVRGEDVQPLLAVLTVACAEPTIGADAVKVPEKKTRRRRTKKPILQTETVTPEATIAESAVESEPLPPPPIAAVSSNVSHLPLPKKTRKSKKAAEPFVDDLPEHKVIDAAQDIQSNADVPDALMNATRLKEVLNYFEGQGLTLVDDLVAACTKWAPHVPILRDALEDEETNGLSRRVRDTVEAIRAGA